MEDQICISHFSIRETEPLRDIENQVSCRDLTLYNCGRWLSSFIKTVMFTSDVEALSPEGIHLGRKNGCEVGENMNNLEPTSMS